MRDGSDATLQGLLRTLDGAISQLSNPYKLGADLASGKTPEPRAKTIAFHLCVLNPDVTASIHRVLDYVPGKPKDEFFTLETTSTKLVAGDRCGDRRLARDRRRAGMERVPGRVVNGVGGAVWLPDRPWFRERRPAGPLPQGASAMTPPGTGKEVHLVLYPHGEPRPGDFAVVEVPCPTGPGPGSGPQPLLSVDPYMRGRMSDAKSYVPPFELGEPMPAVRWARSSPRSADRPAGDVVLHYLGWREYAIVDAAAFRRVPAGAAPARPTSACSAWSA